MRISTKNSDFSTLTVLALCLSITFGSSTSLAARHSHSSLSQSDLKDRLDDFPIPIDIWPDIIEVEETELELPIEIDPFRPDLIDVEKAALEFRSLKPEDGDLLKNIDHIVSRLPISERQKVLSGLSPKRFEQMKAAAAELLDHRKELKSRGEDIKVSDVMALSEAGDLAALGLLKGVAVATAVVGSLIAIWLSNQMDEDCESEGLCPTSNSQ